MIILSIVRLGVVRS